MKTIVITGGSSGIGAALARAYAGPGVRICIVGRDPGRLAEVAGEVEEKGGHCETAQVDITDRQATATYFETLDARSPVDMVFINAGIFDGRKPDEAIEDLDTSLRVLDTNLHGVLHTLHAVLECPR